MQKKYISMVLSEGETFRSQFSDEVKLRVELSDLISVFEQQNMLLEDYLVDLTHDRYDLQNGRESHRITEANKFNKKVLEDLKGIIDHEDSQVFYAKFNQFFSDSYFSTLIYTYLNNLILPFRNIFERTTNFGPGLANYKFNHTEGFISNIYAQRCKSRDKLAIFKVIKRCEELVPEPVFSPFQRRFDEEQDSNREGLFSVLSQYLNLDHYFDRLPFVPASFSQKDMYTAIVDDWVLDQLANKVINKADQINTFKEALKRTNLAQLKVYLAGDVLNDDATKLSTDTTDMTRSSAVKKKKKKKKKKKEESDQSGRAHSET